MAAAAKVGNVVGEQLKSESHDDGTRKKPSEKRKAGALLVRSLGTAGTAMVSAQPDGVSVISCFFLVA